MNPARLDAALAAALAERGSDASARFLVFVRLRGEASVEEIAMIRRRAPFGDAQAGTIVSATVSRSDIDALSELPAVQSIRLSQRMKPL